MKPYAARIICVLVLASAIVTLNSASAQTGPTIPSWVHAGLTVAYNGISAFMSNGRPSQSIEVVMTTRVNAVNGGQVEAVTEVQTVGSPVQQTHAWTCNATGSCATDATRFSAQFWVDPADPTESVRGPNGETYKVMGSGPYTYNGKTWAATTMSYQNPASGEQLMCIFETKTGLIVAYSETDPSEQVHTYIRSVSGE